MADLVVIRTYTIAQFAHLDAGLLADAGIDSTIQDEVMGTMMPHLSNAMGNIKLLVRAEDADRARETLDEHEEPGESDEPALSDEPEPVEDVERCPECGAEYLASREPAWKGFGWFALFALRLPLIPSLKKRCWQCGHQWSMWKRGTFTGGT